MTLWHAKPVDEYGPSSAVPSNPNSRLGGFAIRLAQGWDQMDAVIVGIDVAKDKLDVCARASGARVNVELPPAVASRQEALREH